MKYSNAISPSLLKVLSVLVFIVGFLSPYLFMRYGINYGDEPYQIMVAQNYMDSPMSFFSAWMVHQWGRLFGWEIITMRYYAVSIQMFGMMCVAIYFWYSTKNIFLTFGVMGLCAFFYNVKPAIPYIIGWDATSNCFIMLTALILLLYLKNSKWWKLLLLALLTVCTIFSRLPNVCIIGAIAFVILVHGWSSNQKKLAMRHIVILLGIVVVLGILMISVFYGSPIEFASSLAINSVGSHGLKDLIQYPLLVLIGDIPILFFTWIPYFVIKWLKNFELKRKQFWLALGLFFVIFTLVGFGSFTQRGGGYNDYASIAYLYLCIVLIITRLRHDPGNGDSYSLIWATIVLCCTFPLVSAFGSNVFYTKILSVPFIAIIFVYLRKFQHQQFKIYTTFIALFISITLLGQKYLGSFFDYGPIAAKETIKIEKFNGLLTIHNRAAKVERTMAAINTDSCKNKIFLSDFSFRFLCYYLSDIKPPYDLHNWEDGLYDNPNYVNQTIGHIKKADKPLSVFMTEFYGRPNSYDGCRYVCAEETLMSKELMKLQPDSVLQYSDDIRIYQYQ